MMTMLLAARVAVLVAGDPSGASLTSAVEARFALAADTAVVPAAEIAAAIGAPADAQPASSSPKLQEAEEAYFAARLDEAEKIVKEAEAGFAKDAFSDRVRASLLRAAIAAKRGDAAAAEKVAQTALALDPEAKADAYPPAVQTVVEAARSKLPERIPLKVAATPADASVTVDGRAVSAGTVTVVPGVHVISARAPGFRTVRRSVNVTKASTLRVALPAALGTELDSALVTWLGGKSAAPESLAALAAKLATSRIVVIAQSGNDVRAGSWTSDGKTALGGPYPIVGGESPALADWAGGIATGTATLAVATPAPTKSPVTPPRAGGTPLVKKPLFWGAVGAVVLAAAAGAVVTSSGKETKTVESDGTTTITW